MLNHSIVMGRLTKDPELRRTDSGIAVTSFSIACDRDFTNKDSGERETDFIDCVAWRSTAEFVSKYFSKGNMIVVSGRLQMRNYTDKDGNKRRVTEIVADNVYFGEGKKDRDSDTPSYGNQTAAPNYGTQPPAPAGYQQQGFGGYQAPPQQMAGAYQPPQQGFTPVTGYDPNMPWQGGPYGAR